MPGTPMAPWLVVNWPNGLTAAGFYGAIAAGDLNGDGNADIIGGRDHHILNAYSGTGISLPGWPIETYLNGNSGNYQTDYRVVHGLERASAGGPG